MTLFRGLCTATVTPFTRDGEFDFDGLSRLIARQVSADVDALGLLGTTGEDATISTAERERFLHEAMTMIGKRKPVVVGVGTASTRETVANVRISERAGADMLMVTVPYYSRTTEEGLLGHFKSIADATDLPLMIYNVPKRTGIAPSADFLLELAEGIPSILAIKDSSADIGHIADLIRGRPSRLAIYSGDEESTLPMMLLGCDGMLAVLSNVAPLKTKEFVDACISGKWDVARDLHLSLLPAMRACFARSNPIPVKSVLARAGLIGETMRLPLAPLKPDDVYSGLNDLQNLVER